MFREFCNIFLRLTQHIHSSRGWRIQAIPSILYTKKMYNNYYLLIYLVTGIKERIQQLCDQQRGIGQHVFCRFLTISAYEKCKVNEVSINFCFRFFLKGFGSIYRLLNPVALTKPTCKILVIEKFS
jgi:hypothetical protein